MSESLQLTNEQGTKTIKRAARKIQDTFLIFIKNSPLKLRVSGRAGIRSTASSGHENAVLPTAKSAQDKNYTEVIFILPPLRNYSVLEKIFKGTVQQVCACAAYEIVKIDFPKLVP